MIQDRKHALSAFDKEPAPKFHQLAQTAANPAAHGSGNASAEAAAVQSHWAEGAALAPKGEHEELARALDEPAEHEAATPHLVAAASVQAHAATAKSDVTIGDTASHHRTTTNGVYQENLANDKKAKVNITDPRMKGDLALFKNNWSKNAARYESVSAQTGVPAKLVAALHWRESSGNFNTYLHNGDPLGKPTVHVPKGILFYSWEPAAVHALNQHKSVQNDLGMNAKTTDIAAMGTYAEFYNGLGYYNKNRVSPYVFSGTDVYHGGKYVSDGHYDPNTKDAQLGVFTMIESLAGVQGSGKVPPTPTPPPATEQTLKQGSTGAAVLMLQQKLKRAGEHVSVDGDFGPGTLAAVKDFQHKHGLGADGVVGPATWAALDKIAGRA